jgi:hypothetical protein
VLIAALVLLWGSAFKASLYHSFRDLTNVPTAKLLTEQEHPAQAAHVEKSNYATPPASHAASHLTFLTATPPAMPQFRLLALLAIMHLTPIQSNAALGFYFHHPPPLF